MKKRIALAVNRLSFLRGPEKQKLCAHIAAPEDLMRWSLNDLRALTGRNLRPRAFSLSQVLQLAGKDFAAYQQGRFHFLLQEDEAYPPLLREIHAPPFLLFYRGALPDPERPAVAVVGTRNPSTGGREGAARLGRELAQAGIEVVSGLARGVDVAAHTGVMAGGGRTFAVLGSGIDRIYPSGHRGVAARMLENGGGIVSEYAPGIEPFKQNFPARNRIISGLCRGIVVIEAPERSGALITADFALQQGRDLFVYGRGGTGRGNAGVARLREEGAPVIGRAFDLLSRWRGFSPASVKAHSPSEKGGVSAYLSEKLEDEIGDGYDSIA